MDNKNPNEIKIDISPEVAGGVYSNLAVISHSPNEFFVDFISLVPNMGPARVQSRVIMSPENAKNLMLTLRDNIAKYEKIFGEIKPKQPVNPAPSGKGPDDIPNPFMA
ncbi:MAG: DUF3467 domain-containing protein [Muribaculaceae bacterium]|nr:DUF3467 domain-containing protein [Muribaculaceae bacterium]